MQAIYGQLLGMVERLHPQALFQVRGTSGRQVALTIDDGPSSRTGEILDLLQRFEARATFFLHTDPVEALSGAETLLRRMEAEGHEVGNHMPDPRVSLSLSATEFEREFERAHGVLERVGASPKFFRAAGGLYHPERMAPVLRRLGYYERFILASYLPWDTHLPFPQQYARHLAAGAFPGAIFVLHDGDQRVGNNRLERTMIALRVLLAQLQKGGFAAVPLGHLIAETE